MQIRVIRFGSGGRRGGLALGAMAVAIGGLFIVFGLMLLAALATVGVVAGAGALLLRGLRRMRGPGAPTQPELAMMDLDPALEVRPPDDARRIASP